MTELKNQTALITGASKGFGKSLALELAKEGCSLILTARDASLLEEVASTCRELGCPQCEILPGDITSRDFLTELTELGLAKKIDILVNNAGVVDIRPLDEVPHERIDTMLELNLAVPIHLTRSFLPLFKERRSGTFLNVNSTGGRRAVPEHTIYCATKHGLNGLFDTLRDEVAGYGIRIFNVCPGKMATNLFAAAGVEFDTSEFIPPDEMAATTVAILKMSPICSPTEFAVDRMKR